MPQHLWTMTTEVIRFCEVCRVWQAGRGSDWTPPISAICPGDDNDDCGRVTRPRPNAPSGAPRVLEVA